jgi:hypothetical protein
MPDGENTDRNTEDLQTSAHGQGKLAPTYESADKRPPGHLSRQGPEALRWALYEVAQSAARSTSTDHVCYLGVKKRLNHKRACLSVARKVCRPAHRILRSLGADAFAPVNMSVLPSFEQPILETA